MSGRITKALNNQYVTRSEFSAAMTDAFASLSKLLDEKLGRIGDELKRNDSDFRDTEMRLRSAEEAVTVLKANAQSAARFWGVLSGIASSVFTAIIIKLLLHL